MAVHAQGKPIRGEKTPAHIYFVPTLLAWFPNAKIIHTFRDPRAIYISSKTKADKKYRPRYSALFRKLGVLFELYSSLQIILPWLQMIRLHHRYRKLYPNQYYLSRYEHLVCAPQDSLRDLCDFLEIDFTEPMLQQSVINSSYVPNSQIAGFDMSAIDRWREHLHPLINKWFLLWCRKRLVEFGYQP